MTAAMCQGNNLEQVRDDFPDAVFRHRHLRVARRGLCRRTGQERLAADRRHLQHLPATQLRSDFPGSRAAEFAGTFLLDRAGLTGPDGPTHHGVFDLGYMRLFPNMVVMAPGDEADLPPMLDFALAHDSPVSIRYPKATAERIDRSVSPDRTGPRRSPRMGPRRHDHRLRHAAGAIASRPPAPCANEGLDVGVINARFIKPLDKETLLRAVETSPFVVTVEEGALMGGFGSALLEAANDAGLATNHFAGSAFPTGSSSMAIATSCWPTWGSTSPASPAFAASCRPPNWPTRPAAAA